MTSNVVISASDADTGTIFPPACESLLTGSQCNDHRRRTANLILIDVGVEELLVGGVDDSGAVRGREDMGLAIGVETAQHDGLGAQADLLALRQCPC